jgi:hypothetical protein
MGFYPILENGMAGRKMLKEYSLSGIRCVYGGKIEKKPAAVSVGDSRIAGLGKKCAVDYDLGGEYYLYPALINVHDHLRGDYLPRVGPKEGEYYLNWAPWDKDLKSSPVYSERAHIGLHDSYLLGAYKNLFSGVVTVNDHFPHEFNEPFIPMLPVRVIREYALAHECSSYDLNWGDGIEIEHRRARKRNHPFITHLEEGYDRESQGGVELLERVDCLDDHGVFIHCIGFSEDDIRMVKKAGSHVVWCPASNLFMFNLTCKIKKFIEQGINISLGTDSTHTGSVNILEEMRFARKVYRNLYKDELPASLIFSMVTINPAKAFRMQDRIGSLDTEKYADLLVVKEKHEDPFESLLLTDLEDIELLTREGDPLYGSERFEDLFRGRNVPFSRIRMKDKPMLVVGDPAGLLQKIRKQLGFQKILDFMPLNV